MPDSRNILFVDDDEDCCELIIAMLHYAGVNYNVIVAPTPQKALELMARQSFDLFVIDYSLPEMTGVDLCRRIRETDADTPIVFYTATAQPQKRREAMDAGANAYLIKPNDLDNIVDTIRKFLDK
jgi:CheY-like chemotaxis protein